jgi:hypothetical protein
MGEFLGTKREFNRFFGPHLRNLVQNITRKYRKEIGKCEHCGINEKLESAHITGKERTVIIDKILDEYYSVNNYKVDLVEFENKFKTEHQNLKEIILILCKNCHSKYDNKTLNNKQKPKIEKKEEKKLSNRIFTNSQIQKELSKKLKNFEQKELDKFCDLEYSKSIFKNNTPLLIKIKKDTPIERKKEIVRDGNVNRWTWKYEFEKGNFIYAISTQWYPKNDEYVKKWIEEN